MRLPNVLSAGMIAAEFSLLLMHPWQSERVTSQSLHLQALLLTQAGCLKKRACPWKLSFCNTRQCRMPAVRLGTVDGNAAQAMTCLCKTALQA